MSDPTCVSHESVLHTTFSHSCQLCTYHGYSLYLTRTSRVHERCLIYTHQQVNMIRLIQTILVRMQSLGVGAL